MSRWIKFFRKAGLRPSNQCPKNCKAQPKMKRTGKTDAGSGRAAPIITTAVAAMQAPSRASQAIYKGRTINGTGQAQRATQKTIKGMPTRWQIRLRRSVSALLGGGTYFDDSYAPLSVVAASAGA